MGILPSVPTSLIKTRAKNTVAQNICSGGQ